MCQEIHSLSNGIYNQSKNLCTVSCMQIYLNKTFDFNESSCIHNFTNKKIICFSRKICTKEFFYSLIKLGE